MAYKARPLEGIWATSPYLHNGSVPTLWDLLQPPEKRPQVFITGSDVYDPVNVGFVTSGAQAKASADFTYDTRLEGNHNSGHLYGTTLSDDDKRALIEFMKTL